MQKSVAIDGETAGPVPHAEPLDLLPVDPLVAYLDRHGLGAGPLEATPIGAGRSNLTYLIRRGADEFVLRRPPGGTLPPSAHDVLREARILQALEATDVPVPRVLAVCSDEAVIGAPFVVMERLDGVVISQAVPEKLATPDACRQLSEELMETLARVHAVDLDAAGLTNLGRPTGYLERQVVRHLQLWDLHRTRDLPRVSEIGEWLLANIPEPCGPTLVHGDFRLGNAMFDPLRPSLVAILDWELSTVGDPLVDIGYACACWVEAGDPPERPWQPDPATRAAGFLTRDELVSHYEEAAKRRIGDLRWYEVLALWRGVVFMEGNYRRARDGGGADADTQLLAFGPLIPHVAEMAYARITSGSGSRRASP